MIYVFDGVDGIGKSTLINEFKIALCEVDPSIVDIEVIHVNRNDMIKYPGSRYDYHMSVFNKASINASNGIATILDRSILTTLFYEPIFHSLDDAEIAKLTIMLDVLLRIEHIQYYVLTSNDVEFWRNRFRLGLSKGKSEMYDCDNDLIKVYDLFKNAGKTFKHVRCINVDKVDFVKTFRSKYDSVFSQCIKVQTTKPIMDIIENKIQPESHTRNKYVINKVKSAVKVIKRFAEVVTEKIK